MSQEHTPPQHWTYRVEAAPVPPSPAPQPNEPAAQSLLHLLINLQHQNLETLRQIQEIQKEQLALLRETVHVSREQRSRQAAELERWQNSHEPHLEQVKETLSQLERVHASLLSELISSAEDNYENLLDGDFALTDFVDRFGPRLAHLNTILAVLRPLTIVLNPGNTAKKPDA